jgi:hypothetical protein
MFVSDSCNGFGKTQPGFLSGPECDPGLGKIIRGHFHGDLVARYDANEMFPHFSGNMSQNNVTVSELDPKHCSGKHFNNNPFCSNCFFFGHKIQI